MRWTRLFGLFCLLLLGLAFSGGDLTYFGIRIHDVETGNWTDHRVGFDLHANDFDLSILEYCEVHKIQSSFCDLLYANVVSAARALREDEFKALPNPHLERHQAALDAERSRLFSIGDNFDFSSIRAAEQRAVDSIFDSWIGRNIKRVAVVHSCTIGTSPESTRILVDIIAQFQHYNLGMAVDQIIVLNYGDQIPEDALSAVAHDLNVKVLHVFDAILHFEVPTMRILHALSKHLHSIQRSLRPAAQLLYVHTKGVSYARTYQQIEDWRHMMLYHLVGRHETCDLLLRSGEVDCLGTNYKSDPRRIFTGNFWRCSVAHLAALPPLQHEHSGKYEAESWVLSRPGTRIFVLHSSNVNHAEHPYPPLCYAEGRHGVYPYALGVPLDGDETAAAHTSLGSALQREDALCGGPPTVREQRRFWALP